MNYFEKRRLSKLVKHLLHEARHARHMREDVTSGDLLADLDQRMEALQQASKSGADKEEIHGLCERLAESSSKVMPPREPRKIRENVEVIVVALVVALGFRTYFIQPFKIPTGSMQPTLNGITFHPPASLSLFNAYPLRLFNTALFGKYPVQIRAVQDGRVRYLGYGKDAFIMTGPGRNPDRPKIKNLDTSFLAHFYTIVGSNMRMPIPSAFETYVKDGDLVHKGDLLAAGTICLGDHIFVNKVKYNFSRPQRGDIFVFDTRGIDFPNIKTNNFYIKRLVGLPGECVAIHQPDREDDVTQRYLLADGKKVDAPYPFYRLLHGAAEGYNGYVFPGVNSAELRRAKLALPGDELCLGAGEYLPFGDNSRESLDGRYFGAVRQEDIVGPAFAVYWPLSRRWGFTK